MCKIEEVPGFRLNGRLHETREAAITAGLTEIASDIQRQHASNVLTGLLAHKDALIYLLTEHSQTNDTPKSS